MTGIARLTKFSCEACLWGVVQVVRGCPGRLRNIFTLPLVVFGSVLFVFGVHWLVAVRRRRSRLFDKIILELTTCSPHAYDII